MVEHRTCDYSGKEIEPGTGIMYVRTDGTVLHFADSKAEKNYLLGREARDLEWTEAGRGEKASRARAAEKAAGDVGTATATEEAETPDEPETAPEAADEEGAAEDDDAEGEDAESGDSEDRETPEEEEAEA